MPKRSLRHYAWNYTAKGDYHVTIVTAKRRPFLAFVQNEELHLTEVGEIAKHCIEETSRINPNIEVIEYVVMPDHLHLLLRVQGEKYDPSVGQNQFGVQSGSLGACVRGIKSAITSRARKIQPNFKWVSRYQDNIIMDQREFENVRNYIRNNPQKLIQKLQKRR